MDKAKLVDWARYDASQTGLGVPAGAAVIDSAVALADYPRLAADLAAQLREERADER